MWFQQKYYVTFPLFLGYLECTIPWLLLSYYDSMKIVAAQGK